MKLEWLTFFLICAIASAALIPRMKRSEQTDGGSKVKICAPSTPCAWSIYNSHAKMIEMNLTNTYCSCSADKTCQVYEDDTATNALVYRCMKPKS